MTDDHLSATETVSSPNYETWESELKSRHYLTFMPNPSDHYDTLSQKCFDDENGMKYFLNFRRWQRPSPIGLSYDAEFVCKTDTGGTVWTAIIESSIDEIEKCAEQLWLSVGGIYYER